MPATLANTEFEMRKYDLDSKTYRARFDPGATTPTMAVVAALSELTGTPPMELEPLQSSVDTDALDRLASDRKTGERSVTFPVETYTVTVHSDGIVVVGQSEPESERTESPAGQYR